MSGKLQNKKTSLPTYRRALLRTIQRSCILQLARLPTDELQTISLSHPYPTPPIPAHLKMSSTRKRKPNILGKVRRKPQIRHHVVNLQCKVYLQQFYNLFQDTLYDIEPESTGVSHCAQQGKMKDAYFHVQVCHTKQMPLTKPYKKMSHLINTSPLKAISIEKYHLEIIENTDTCTLVPLTPYAGINKSHYIG
jgi:hypothetical protein